VGQRWPPGHPAGTRSAVDARRPSVERIGGGEGRSGGERGDDLAWEGGWAPRTVRDLVKWWRPTGGSGAHQVGGNRQYRHSVKKGRVTVSGKLGEDVYPKTERSIVKQAGLIGGAK
jgi:predicted RNA binding protein YcfA (HicA-like mRNA interferase family)